MLIRENGKERCSFGAFLAMWCGVSEVEVACCGRISFSSVVLKDERPRRNPATTDVRDPLSPDAQSLADLTLGREVENHRHTFGDRTGPVICEEASLTAWLRKPGTLEGNESSRFECYGFPGTRTAQSGFVLQTWLWNGRSKVTSCSTKFGNGLLLRTGIFESGISTGHHSKSRHFTILILIVLADLALMREVGGDAMLSDSLPTFSSKGAIGIKLPFGIEEKTFLT